MNNKDGNSLTEFFIQVNDVDPEKKEELNKIDFFFASVVCAKEKKSSVWIKC